MKTNLTPWTFQSDYTGMDFTGWFIAPIVHVPNASTILDETNWDIQKRVLLPLASGHVDVPKRTTMIKYPDVAVCSFRPWNTDYEIMLIHPSNIEAMHAAEELQQRYDDYPVLEEKQ